MNKQYVKNFMTFGDPERNYCYIEDGYLVMGCGYYAIRLLGAEPPWEFCGDKFKAQVEKLFDAQRDKAKSNIKVPSKKEMEEEMKGVRRDGGVYPYDLCTYPGNEKSSAPLVDGFYLLDTLRVLGGMEAPMAYHDGSGINPLYLWFYNGNEITAEAIVLPRRRKRG